MKSRVNESCEWTNEFVDGFMRSVIASPKLIIALKAILARKLVDKMAEKKLEKILEKVVIQKLDLGSVVCFPSFQPRILSISVVFIIFHN